MGRWRPPVAQSSPYITPAGFEALQEELKALWLRRREVVAALSAAAAEGDRSENAEYIYRKKELGGLDYRIRYLQKRLPVLNVVRELANSDAVFFGAIVQVRNDAGELFTYRLVGADEADPGCHDISIDSALAKSLRGKRVGDQVTIGSTGKSTTYTIESIHYT